MPAPSTVFHQRRLSHGAGECLAIGPVAVPGDETGFRQGVHIKPWRCSSPAVHRWYIAPRGWGSPVAGVEHPPPLSHASPVERFSLEHPHLPAAPRLLPPPSEGAGSEWRLARWPCTGTEAGSLGVSGETAKRLPDPRRLHPWGITPGGGADGEGVEHPPLFPASPIERCS